ncbi:MULTISPECIES: hypothetical protein [unclassified Cryobacterium]|uniref:hypothetical protein n=1 Tax=unclassified Cryobacterium TaxID=2649013 RepID=UPI001445BF4C|nr:MULTISPECIES: hypothetical protein [unclassified Cryobacterium]
MTTEGVVILTIIAVLVVAPFVLIPLLARRHVKDGRRADENGVWQPSLSPGYLFARFWVKLPRPEADRIARQILEHLRFHTRRLPEATYQFVLPNGSFVTVKDFAAGGGRSLWLMKHRATSTATGTRLVMSSFSGPGTVQVADGWFTGPMTPRQERWVVGRLSAAVWYSYAIRDRDRDAGSIVIRPQDDPRPLAPGDDTRSTKVATA